MRIIVAALLLLVASSVNASQIIVVQGIKMPAWVQRGSVMQPLSIGMAINNGDRITTGADARVLLQSADDSAIKLGENANLIVSDISLKREEKGLFSALLDVAKGAFRFTTGSLAKLKPRDVTVRVAGATIGIRGTDVWGKVGASMSIAAMENAMGKNLDVADKESKMEFDTVCLIEGNISVVHNNEASFVMDQPKSFYVMPKGEEPLPVAGLSSEQLAAWAGQTEIAPGKGALRRGGKWKVVLLTSSNRRDVSAVHHELRSAGYDARIRSLQGEKYQVRITQLSSKADAQALAAHLSSKMDIAGPTVER